MSCIYLKVSIISEIATILHNNQHVERIPLHNYHVNSDDFYLIWFKINVFQNNVQHFDISSVLLFNRTCGSARVIIIFSVRHKSHLFVPHFYQDAYDFILHRRWSHLLLTSKGICKVPYR